MARVDDPWVKLYQNQCLEDAANGDLPLWLRVAYLAYGTVTANRHANFSSGEIAETLGKPKNRVSEAIRTAIEYRHLDEGSSVACLVVPSSKIGGGIGNRFTQCKHHARTKAAAEKLVDMALAELYASDELLPVKAEAVSG